MKKLAGRIIAVIVAAALIISLGLWDEIMELGKVCCDSVKEQGHYIIDAVKLFRN